MSPDASRAQDEADLLTRIAGGDEAALSELYDRYSPILLALARRVLGSVADAEEVLQEVFVHAWNRAESYDRGRSSVSTWLALITRSRAIDRLRSRKVVDRVAEAARQEAPAAHESPRASASVLVRERRHRISGALNGLPLEQRQVVELAYFKGLTQSEIARQEGIPLGTVKTRTLLAMRKLRQALASDIEELL